MEITIMMIKSRVFFFSSSEGRKHIIIKFRIFYLKLFPETMDKNGYY